jgi:Thiolase, C-terminal domain
MTRTDTGKAGECGLIAFTERSPGAPRPARELKRSETRYGIASACIGGGQGIALLVENPRAA